MKLVKRLQQPRVQLRPLGWKVVFYELSNDQGQLLECLVAQNDCFRLLDELEQFILDLPAHLICHLLGGHLSLGRASEADLLDSGLGARLRRLYGEAPA